MPVKLQSSSGGSVTLQTGSTASNYTHTVPSVDGTVMVSGNMPTFCAYQSSAQTISNSTWTKLQFQTEEWDTANCFDSTTNYRFTPNVAGYYQVNMAVAYGPGTNSEFTTALYKNGSNYKYFWDISTTWYLVNGSVTVYLNGSTDYIELYAWIATGQALNANAINTYFQAIMVRSA